MVRCPHSRFNLGYKTKQCVNAYKVSGECFSTCINTILKATEIELHFFFLSKTAPLLKKAGGWGGSSLLSVTNTEP